MFGPILVNYVREYQIENGLPKAQAYDVTMYVLAALLVVGLICNLLVRPVADKHFMTEAELAAEKKLAHERDAAALNGNGAAASDRKTSAAAVAFGWLAVGIPLAIGVAITVEKAAVLFK